MRQTVDQILLRLKTLEKAGNLAAARELCQQTLATYPANTRLRSISTRLSHQQQPAQHQFDALRHLFQRQNYSAVLTEGQKLTTAFPHSPTLFNILAAAATRLGQAAQAAAFYRSAIQIDPSFLDAHTNLGQLWLVEGDWQAAADSFARALTLRPQHPAALHGLAKALIRLQDFDQAAQVIQRALNLQPENADLILTLARIRNLQGDLAASEQAYLQVIALGPQAATAARELAEDHRFTPGDPLIARLTALRPSTPSDCCEHAFALFKLHHDLGDLDQAFNALTEGNRLRRSLLAYDPAQDQHQFKALHATAPTLAGHALAATPTDPQPIFIVGLPRSGTSLLEQILSCHSDIAAGGELPWLGRAGLDLATGKQPASLAALQTLRDTYLHEIKPLAKGKPRLTDKMPHNFRLVALIRAALPQAHIIHVQRNPAAVCWSNYRHYFSTNALGYAYDLADVVAFHGLYRSLMQTWADRFGPTIYHLTYETLTQHPEAETRRLLTHLGLPFQDACLSPQNNRHTMRTVSQQQVKQPIYTGSSQAWRRYEPFLGGAFDNLI